MASCGKVLLNFPDLSLRQIKLICSPFGEQICIKVTFCTLELFAVCSSALSSMEECASFPGHLGEGCGEGAEKLSAL